MLSIDMMSVEEYSLGMAGKFISFVQVKWSQALTYLSDIRYRLIQLPKHVVEKCDEGNYQRGPTSVPNAYERVDVLMSSIDRADGSFYFWIISSPF